MDVLDDLSTGSIENIRHLKDKPGFAYTIDSAESSPVVAELVDGADAVYHLAAAVGVQLIVESPVRTIETNVHCTEVVLAQASKSADRVREILAALLDPAFAGFPRQRIIRFAAAVGMTQYSEHLDALLQTIFPPQSLANVLGQVVADAGRAQLRMAETEKYPHVTYFLNGGEESAVRGRGTHHGAVAEGCDLRPAAGNVGAGIDGQGGGGDRLPAGST